MEVWEELCGGWEALGWESKGRLDDRGQRGRAVHSPLLLKDMVLLMWVLTGPECICPLPQRCGFTMGRHIVLSLHLHTLKDEPLLSNAKGFKLQQQQILSLKTQLTCTCSTKISVRFEKPNLLSTLLFYSFSLFFS